VVERLIRLRGEGEGDKKRFSYIVTIVGSVRCPYVVGVLSQILMQIPRKEEKMRAGQLIMGLLCLIYEA
jgi:hypothetical protein